MNKRYNEITGIILAGGESSRMNMNKSLLKVNSVTLIERTKKLLENLFDTIIISANEVEEYRFLNLSIVEDIYKGLGPLSGIHAGLNASSTEKNFFISCDLPFITEEMIRYIIDYDFSEMALIPSADGKNQYMCGVYKKDLIPVINIIRRETENSKNENGKYDSSLRKLIQVSDARIIEVNALPFYSRDLFFNMNTETDYEYVRKKYQE